MHTFGNVGHNNTDEKDNGVQPMVAQNKCNDEECDAQKDGDASDYVYEVLDLSGDWCLSHCQPWSEVSNPSHYSSVAGVDHNASGGALHTIGREKGQIAGFQWIITGQVKGSGLWLRLTGQWRVVYFASMSLIYENTG